MNDAPERIWAWDDTGEWTVGMGMWDLLKDGVDPEQIEYTRADLCITRAGADAMVAAALEGAALECERIKAEAAKYNLPQMAIGAANCRDRIRAMIPATPSKEPTNE